MVYLQPLLAKVLQSVQLGLLDKTWPRASLLLHVAPCARRNNRASFGTVKLGMQTEPPAQPSALAPLIASGQPVSLALGASGGDQMLILCQADALSVVGSDIKLSEPSC